MTYYVFIGLTIAAIISQMPHAYIAIEWNSNLTGRLRAIQSAAFCLIVSIAILAFVFIGRNDLSLGGVIVEVIFNIYYYSEKQRERAWGDKLRRNWFQYFLAVLLPTLIYIFSHILTDLK